MHSISTVRAAFATSMACLLVSCSNVQFHTATAPTPIACDNLVTFDDEHTAKTLDLPVSLIEKIKRIGNTDNVGVCKMSSEARLALLVNERRRTRAPKEQRKATKAASKDYMRMWDADDFGRQPNATQIFNADLLHKYMAAQATNHAKAAGILQNRWTALGPSNVGGRVRAILLDPRDPNRIFVGTASGGIWRSTNGGTTFSPITDFSANLTIGAMAIDPTNPDVMYAGSGESFAALNGVGMFKSTDAGATWNFLQSTSTDVSTNPQGAAWTFINRIAVSAADANIVLAATSQGIFRSPNGGQAWIQVEAINTLDLKFDPFNANNLLAGQDTGTVAYSRDAGLTWQTPSVALVTPTGNNVARAEIAYARSRQNVAYVSLQNNAGDVWKTLDGGLTWALVSNPKHLETQGDYDNTIWVDPLNENHLVIGGIDLYRSINGGQSFTKISTWGLGGPGLPQPHADHHVIVSAPNYSATNPVVYIGNDGGIFRSTDITRAGPDGTTTWENLNATLAVTQFYGGAGLRSAGGKYIGGTQDNGDVQLVNGTNWAEIGGGDGGFVAVDPTGDDVRYGEYTHANVRRYIGTNRTDICSGITEGNKDQCGPGATQRTNFISPFILDPNASSRMLVGANSLWVSDDVRNPQMPAWRTIKPPVVVADNTEHFINAIDVARGNANLIWVGHNAAGNPNVPTHLYKTVNGLSATPSWQLMSVTGMPASGINRVTIDPDDHNRLWVVYSGFSSNRAWVTDNGGATWRSISAGLPAVSLFDIKRHPTQRSWLYIAAANGVYTSEDAGVTWSTVNDGPNSVRVRELFWYDQETLVATTFGRGMFSQTIAAAPVPQLPLSRRGGIDLDGNGSSALMVRSTANNQLQAGRLVNNQFQWTSMADPGSDYRLLGAVDFARDGKSDLAMLRENPTTLNANSQGTVQFWRDFTDSSHVFLRDVKPTWDVQAAGDLDGDGFGDLVWRFRGMSANIDDQGVSYIWFTNGTGFAQLRKRGGAPLTWSILGAFDLNSDGASDMIYLSPGNAMRVLMSTPSRTCANLSGGSIPENFAAVKFADFTGNRRGDVLVRNATSGEVRLISMNATGLVLPPYTGDPDNQNASCTSSTLAVTQTVLNIATADPAWSYYASGDFNGDGIFDVVWRRPDNTLTVWLMNANGAAPTVINNAGMAPANTTLFPLQ